SSWAALSGVTENRLQAGQVELDPLAVDGSPVLDAIMASVVAFAIVLDEATIDIKISQCRQGVLSGSPWHAGGCSQCGDAGGRTAVDQPGDIQASVETGGGLPDGHDLPLAVAAAHGRHGL